MRIALKILDTRLPEWGFPSYGSSLAAGLDLHACLGRPVALAPQAPAVLIPAGFALRIGRPGWCALVLPRSGLGHKVGLVLGNAVGLIDADYEGEILVSAWNRNPAAGAQDRAAESPVEIVIHPGDRIAQLVFTRVARPTFDIVAGFPDADGRQQRGFGSTGVGPACREAPGRTNSDSR